MTTAPADTPAEVLTIEEAAAILRISRNAAYAAARQWRRHRRRDRPALHRDRPHPPCAPRRSRPPAQSPSLMTQKGCAKSMDSSSDRPIQTSSPGWRQRSASSLRVEGSANASTMSWRRSSTIGTSSSAERTLSVRCRSVARSRVSRFAPWLGTLDGDTTVHHGSRLIRVSVSTCFCVSACTVITVPANPGFPESAL